MEKIRLVTATENNNEELYLDKKGNISYKENNEKVTITNLDSTDRPVKFSDLTNKLNNRRWNIPIKKVILDNNLCYFSDDLTESDSVHMDFNKNVYLIEESDKTNLIKIDQGLDMNKLISDFNNLISSKSDKYKKYLDKTVTIFNSSKIVIDLLNKSIKFNLINPGYYTDTVSLINLKNKDLDSTEVKATIEYNIDGILHQKTVIFNSNLDHIDKNSEISIEYIDNILKVFPVNPEIDECTITSCFVIYGKN